MHSYLTLVRKGLQLSRGAQNQIEQGHWWYRCDWVRYAIAQGDGMEERSLDFERPEWVAQMEGILETLNEGVLIADDCDRILFVNSVFEEMTGVSHEEILGKDARKLYYSPEDLAILEERRQKTRETGRSRAEFFLPTKDGGRLPVVVSARILEDPDGRQFVIVTFTDISEQKNAEARLLDANKQLEDRHKEIEEDLVLAARVQQSLAPKSVVWGGIRVETFYHPVRTIGGDFGLVSPLDDQHLNLLVCDVSGHGIGSALVANRIYSETMTQLQNGAPLGNMLRQLNRFVMQNIGSSVFFFTLAAARVDRSGRRMVFAGAGHPPVMVVQPGAEPRLLESRSMVLGALPNAVDMEATLDVDLEPGDRIVLYTDGITDVFDSHGEMLGVEGVQKFVRETALLPFKQMKQGILDRVADWREGPPADDVSLVLVEVN
ncbi:MAG: SpoIIE family protein phosphatase [Candidatus Acidiferrales bacterium]